MCEVLDIIEKRGIEQGIEQGIHLGKLEILINLVSDGTITVKKASEEAGMDEASFKEIMKK